MECHIREVVGAACESEQFAIQHVGKPGERNPVGVVRRGEGPDHAMPRQTGAHLWILGDVLGIVVVYEVMASDLSIYRQDGEKQQDANADVEALGTGSDFAAFAKFAASPRITPFASHYASGARRS